jgi:hypothetical protein
VKQCCEQVEKSEKQYCEQEGITEERTESIIITDNRISSSSSTVTVNLMKVSVEYQG